MGDIDRYYLGGNGLLTTPEALTPNTLAEGYQAIYADTGTMKV